MWHYRLVHISRGWELNFPLKNEMLYQVRLYVLCIFHSSLWCFMDTKWSKLRNYVIKDVNIKTFMHMWNYLFKYLTLLRLFSFYPILFKIFCRCPDPAVRIPTSNAACFLVPDVDARGNTVTHGFILVPATGPYAQQGGVRGHCIILHRRCL